MSEPAAIQPWRVPRSQTDELYSPAPDPPITDKLAGTVVSVEIDTCTVLVFDEEISGVVIQDRVPNIGDEVEIERRGDLWVIVDFLLDSFIEGGNDDAWHIVSDDEPDLPEPDEVQVSGSMRDADDWTASGSWEATWDVSSALMTQVDVNEGLLSSNEIFEVQSGDVINLTMFFTVTQGAPEVMFRIVLATVEDPTPDDELMFESLAQPYTLDETATGTWSLTVPDTITTTNGQNEGIPVAARVEVVLLGELGQTDGIVRIETVKVTRDERTFPTGSLWLNPLADERPTTVGYTELVGTLTPPYTSTWTDLPDSWRVQIDSPGVPGIVLIFWTGSVFIRHDTGTFELRGGSGSPSYARFYTGSGWQNTPFNLVDSIPISADGSVDVGLQYRYISSLPTNLTQVLYVRACPIFIPYAVRPDALTTPSQSYWDGNSWRPHPDDYRGVTIPPDVTTPPAAKVASSSYVTRGSASLSVGETVTITSQVSGSSGTPTGTVTFYEGPSASGPWTSIGSATLSGGKATKTWTGKAGTWRFRGVYGGSSVYNSSEDVTNNDTTVSGSMVTKTKTISASWQQAYNGSGGQVSGSNVDNHVQQGYYSGTHGNRKSLIGFNVSLPSDAEVTKVELICNSWSHWYYGAGGTVVVGWHTRGSKPSSWGVGNGATDRSRHSKNTGSWTVNLTSWATNKVTRSDFGGITIGPGPSTSREYYGYAASGTSPWKLKITYKTAQ